MLEVLETIEAMRAAAREWQRQGHRIALVPTMGSLHQGHLALVDQAHREADRVVVSIFVNPLQFGPNEDLVRYPRTFDQDRARLEEGAACALFYPSAQEMYPEGRSQTIVVVDHLSRILCGVARPGHFAGVTTVVAKLFNIIEPDVAVFGEKDWQQLTIVKHMVRDLNSPVRVVGVPTVRETSGLALSSRNKYLSLEQHEAAPALYRGLLRAQEHWRAGERDREVMRQVVTDSITAVGISCEYVAVVDPDTLSESPRTLSGPTLIALAAHLGKTRLIDNILLEETQD